VHQIAQTQSDLRADEKRPAVRQHRGMADSVPRSISHATAGSGAAAARAVRPRHAHEIAPDAIELTAIADLVAAAGHEVADRARAALAPVLPHDALVLVTPASSGFPVQIAASRGLRERLAGVAWDTLIGEPQGSVPENGAVRLIVPDVIGGLRTAGWMACSGTSRWRCSPPPARGRSARTRRPGRWRSPTPSARSASGSGGSSRRATPRP
jgi:hypothetical protein